MAKTEDDLLFKIKHRAYFLAKLPTDTTLLDLFSYAKFQLAAKTHKLLKDPIWDAYTDEEILQEYFAYLFQENETFRNEFATLIGQVSDTITEDDFGKWADQEILNNQKELLKTLPDKISYKPSPEGE